MIALEAEKILISEVMDGSRSAADELIGHYYSRLFGAAFKILKNTDDAQDVVQEVLFKVFVKKKIKKFKGDSRLGSWLYRITVNECKTLFLKRSRFQETSFENADTDSCEWQAVYSCRPDHIYQKEYVKNQVKKAVENLDGKFQSGLREIYYEERSYKETAGKLELPMHTLGVRIMRAKQMLTAQLESIKWQYTNRNFEWINMIQTA